VWTPFTLDGENSFTFTTAGIYDINLTVSGPGGSNTSTESGYITAGIPTIEVIVEPQSISLGTMSTSEPASGNTTVIVTATGGTSWTVTAADPKGENKGYMVSGATHLASPFEVSNDGGTSYSTLVNDFTNFMSGPGPGSWNQKTDVRQCITAGDAPGDYTITVTFTGAFT
jgi:PKD repeat protein